MEASGVWLVFRALECRDCRTQVLRLSVGNSGGRVVLQKAGLGV